MLKPRSLAARVVLSVVSGSLLSGCIVALVTGVLSERLARDHEDGHLRDAATTLAVELEVKHYDPLYAATEEAQELAHTGIAVAIFERKHFLAGDTSLPFVAPGMCRDAAEMRACSVSAGRRVTVAARARSLIVAQRELTARAAGIALLITSLLSIVLALALGHAAVEPLERLERAARNIPADGGSEADFGRKANVREVDALRVSLQAAFDELRRALVRARSFAGDAAHQLRTPLATIMGELELAVESSDARGLEETLRARDVANRLSARIDRLLILAGADDSIEDTSVISLLDVIEDAFDGLPEAAQQRVQYQADAVRLRGDAVLLKHAIASALDNALAYSSGDVRVSLGARGELAWLAIEDDGPGISPQESARVREPFQPEQTGQTGIGIAVIARVAALHRGSARFVEQAAGTRLELIFARVHD